MLELNCLRLGDPPENAFPIDIDEGSSVSYFREIIKEENKPEFDHLPADALELSLVSIPLDHIKVPFQDPTQFEPRPMDPLDRLNEYFPQQPEHRYLHILVETPPMAEPDNSNSLATPNYAAFIHTADSRPLATFQAPAQGDFGGPQSLLSNRIARLSGAEPPYVTALKEKLEQQRFISANMDTKFLRTKLSNDFDRFFQVNSMQLHDDSARDRWVEEAEFYHYQILFVTQVWRKAGKVCEGHILSDFSQLGSYFQEHLAVAEYQFGADWPLTLIAEVTSGGEKYRYTPRSDFHLSIRDLPLLVFNVQSNPDYSDLYQMLLQASCAVRLGNSFLPGDADPLIVMALYIDNAFRVNRFLLYQPDRRNSSVFYVEKIFRLDRPHQLFKFIFELYNFVKVARQASGYLGKAESMIAMIKYVAKKEDYASFTSNRKRDPTSQHEGSQGSGLGQSCGVHSNHQPSKAEEIYDAQEVVSTLANAGYKLQPNKTLHDNWEPLNKLPPTMRYASHLGKRAVVKLLYYRSNELDILRHLHLSKSQLNHTIPLLDFFKFDLECVIILPEGNRLDIGLDFDFGDSVTDLMHQLVEGVAFLHQHGVAHLDIKPQNVVVNGVRRLWLIDFDISVRVESDESTISLWRGTPGWMAPEIGKSNEPERQYSPIRADRWSCGKVLLYIIPYNRAGGHDHFLALAKQLSNLNPRCRPSLTHWLALGKNQYRGVKRKQGVC